MTGKAEPIELAIRRDGATRAAPAIRPDRRPVRSAARLAIGRLPDVGPIDIQGNSSRNRG
jgi:hypothetical protein